MLHQAGNLVFVAGMLMLVGVTCWYARARFRRERIRRLTRQRIFSIVRAG